MTSTRPAGFTSHIVPVAGSTMHYLEAGSGRPLVFLHGNPTSSFLWRHVLARIDPRAGHRLAIDLIGMGESGKPDIGYHLIDHVDYVDALLTDLGLSDMTFIAHDWGVAICLEYLRRHPDRAQAVTFMEGHLRPLAGWDDFDPGGRKIFQQLRTPGVGERMALDDNLFIETLLPAGMNRHLGAAELDTYRRPYPTPATRRPLLQWAREIPIAGQPAPSTDLMSTAWDHFTRSPVRKLLLHGRPGAVITPTTVAGCQNALENLTVVDVGEASHFLPEDRPAEIAAAINHWLNRSPTPR